MAAKGKSVRAKKKGKEVDDEKNSNRPIVND